MRGGPIVLSMLVISACAASSCGVRRPEDTIIADRYRGPVRSRNIARGRNRYEVVCVPCHGDHTERQGPLLFRLHWYAPEIRHQVREGNSLMPAIHADRLTDEDLEHLLAFFLTTGACDPEPSEQEEIEEVAEVEEIAETEATEPDAWVVVDAGTDAGDDAAIESDAPSDEDAWVIDAAIEPAASTLDAGLPSR